MKQSNQVRRQIDPPTSSSSPSGRSRSRFNPNRGRTRLPTRNRSPSTTTQPPSRTALRTRFRPKTVSSNRNRFSTRPRTTQPPRTSLFDNYDYYDYDYSDTDLQSSQKSVPTHITVTHQVPFMSVIPVRERGITILRDILTTSPSLQVIAATDLKSTNVDNSPVIFAHASTNVAAPGTKVITFEALRATETTGIVFTPTRIRGIRTSFSHIVPSTIYNIQSVTKQIVEPVDQSALLNKLLLQLIGGQLPTDPLKPGANLLAQNPLLGGAVNPAKPLEPATQFKTHTSTYVTTITNTESTVLPITLRGREIKTTVIESKTEVVTATEFSTETIVKATPAAVVGQGLGLGGGATVDLQQQLLAAQLQQQLQQQQLQQQLLNQQLLADPALAGALANAVAGGGGSNPQQPQPIVTTTPPEPISPSPPTPITSITTKFVSGKRPGEFSIVTSTVIIEPEDEESGGGSEKRLKRSILDPSPVRRVEFTVGPESHLESSKLRERRDAADDFFFELQSGMEEPPSANHLAAETAALAGSVRL